MSELPGAGDFPGLSWGELPALGRPVLKHFTKGPALLLLLPVARIGAVLEEAQGPVAVAGSCLARAGCPSCPSSSLAVRPRTPPAPPTCIRAADPPFIESYLWLRTGLQLGTALLVPPTSPLNRFLEEHTLGALGRVRLGRELPATMSLPAPPPTSPSFPPAVSHEKEMRGCIFNSVLFSCTKGRCTVRGWGVGPLLGTAMEEQGQFSPGLGNPLLVERQMKRTGVLVSVPTLMAMQSNAEECIGF